MNTMPTRVDGDLWEAAKASGAIASRSATQQINHWARIGRALEASPNVSGRDVRRVLSGITSYDDVGEPEQAVVRVAWEQQMAQRRESLDFAAEFTAQGRSWSEAGDNGAVVRRPSAQDD
ncbi:hypothetical protein BJY21_001814 [Kineosphaera limosa]|uniref:ParD-like antitoxin of type II toxin-antitoxin system n=1 Tax=Kineosphaera limosa NBRC 100340 TaxID=1184609 RepID=K6VMD1_9MICO|nr:hypothetical protein [Kineosphaera limosa]NYE00630.1 hypothetical protein [Kineosphaera limosa]GAB97363.1 hypothetical protein KILIM_066_00040 [Kineosphaera limosa NBRC 100340]